MGHNLRRDFPFPPPSPAPTPSSDPSACRNELTQMNSDCSASSVTIESFSDPTANPIPESQTMIWTNEKHNSYLEFLEASFVKQLHCSMSLRGCLPREEMWEPCPTPQLHAKVHNASHQLSVLQDGCCQKINDPLLDSTADSSDILGSPLHQFMSAGKNCSATFPFSRETVVPDGGIYLSNNINSSACTAEVSDQNFVYEDQREKANCLSVAKRLKMTNNASCFKQQSNKVSPHGKLNSVE